MLHTVVLCRSLAMFVFIGEGGVPWNCNLSFIVESVAKLIVRLNFDTLWSLELRANAGRLSCLNCHGLSSTHSL